MTRNTLKAFNILGENRFPSRMQFLIKLQKEKADWKHTHTRVDTEYFWGRHLGVGVGMGGAFVHFLLFL